jgi:hypothetical protein
VGTGHWMATDEIDLRLEAIWRRRLEQSFRVAIPRMSRSGEGETHQYLAETKLPRIIDPTGKIGAYITMPLLRFRIPRFVEQLTADVPKTFRSGIRESPNPIRVEQEQRVGRNEGDDEEEAPQRDFGSYGSGV